MTEPINIDTEKTAAATAIINENIEQSRAELGSAAQSIWDTYTNALVTADAYVELLIIGTAAGIGIAIALMLRWIITNRFKEVVQSDSWNWLLKPTKLLAPLFVVVGLSIAQSVITHYTKNSVFLTPSLQVATVWLLIYTVHTLIASNVMAWFLSIVLATIIGLQSFGLLQPIAQLLKNIGFKIGDMEITILGIIQGIVIFILVFWIARASTARAEKQLRSSKLHYNVRELLIKFIKILVYFIALIITLNAVGVDLTAFAVFGGALGVGIGLGLQKITANFVSGITLLLERSIRQGDLIQVGEVHGYVRALNIRYTLVETFGGQEVSIPNETLTSNNIVNWTMSNAKARVEIPIGVAYGSDYTKVRDLLIQAAKEHPRTLKDPSITCVMREFADSSVNFLLQFWIGNVVDGIYSAQSDVMFRIAELFDEHRISIPFPQRDVHIFETKPVPKTAD